MKKMVCLRSKLLGLRQTLQGIQEENQKMGR